jgi:AraC-like DNA-binding protein
MTSVWIEYIATMQGITIIPPPPHLRKHVRNFWYAGPSTHQQNFKILADGTPGIIFQHKHGHSGVTWQDVYTLPVAFAYGQATAPGINIMEAGTSCFGVHFRPHVWKELFRMDASEVTNTAVQLDILPGFGITEKLLNTPDPLQITKLLSDCLWNNLNHHQKEDAIIAHSVQEIASQIATVHAKDLPARYNLSQRQFQRRFQQHMGVSPETYIRILKFQQALQAINHRSFTKLSDIAYDLAFADQSHFIREFKFFSGYTPKELLQQQSPVAVDSRSALPNVGHVSMPATRFLICPQ